MGKSSGILSKLSSTGTTGLPNSLLAFCMTENLCIDRIQALIDISFAFANIGTSEYSLMFELSSC